MDPGWWLRKRVGDGDRKKNGKVNGRKATSKDGSIFCMVTSKSSSARDDSSRFAASCGNLEFAFLKMISPSKQREREGERNALRTSKEGVGGCC